MAAPREKLYFVTGGAEAWKAAGQVRPAGLVCGSGGGVGGLASAATLRARRAHAPLHTRTRAPHATQPWREPGKGLQLPTLALPNLAGGVKTIAGGVSAVANDFVEKPTLTKGAIALAAVAGASFLLFNEVRVGGVVGARGVGGCGWGSCACTRVGGWASACPPAPRPPARTHPPPPSTCAPSTQVGVLFEVAGVVAAGQFLLKLVFAEERQKTFTTIK